MIDQGVPEGIIEGGGDVGEFRQVEQHSGIIQMVATVLRLLKKPEDVVELGL